MAREPLPADVARIPRDEWDRLARSLCVVVYQAQGVEDHRGKGNGMDAWRRTLAGIEGFQARRYDDRFEYKQCKKLAADIDRAARRTATEFKSRLSRYTLVTNIDLEAGHGRKKGEIDRFTELQEKVLAKHGTVLDFHGITWVHTHLLLRPKLLPALFENLEEQLRQVEERLQQRIDAFGAAHNQAIETANKLSKAVAVLLRESRVHFDRALLHHSDEEFILAARCMQDALNLISELELDVLLRGRIELLLANVEARRGRLSVAEAVAREALVHLTEGTKDEQSIARGNLGVILRHMQKYSAAEAELMPALEYFESRGNSVEVTRTLTHLLELEVNRSQLDRAQIWASRLFVAATDLDSMLGPTDVSVSAWGALATSLVVLGQHLRNPALLREAELRFGRIEEIGRMQGSAWLELTARSSRAQAIWYQDHPKEAATLFLEVADRAWPEFGKVAADCLFNGALALREADEVLQSESTMSRAAECYLEIGDEASYSDATKQLELIKQHRR